MKKKKINELKLNGNRFIDEELRSAPISARSHTAESNPLEQVQIENRRLHSELKNLSEKLQRTQNDLDMVKQVGHENDSPRKVERRDVYSMRALPLQTAPNDFEHDSIKVSFNHVYIIKRYKLFMEFLSARTMLRPRFCVFVKS